MQGSSLSRATRIRIAATFAVAFVAGAIAIFAIVGAAGMVLGILNLQFRWRVGLAGAGLLPLAAVDLLAVAKSTYCPIGCRRQTSRILLRRYPLAVVASVWGLDTGLLATTFRVAAISWGALLLTALGLSPWWAGVGYGFGFTTPFLILLFRPRLGRSSRQATPADPGLEVMLRMRAVMQGLSAALLIASGVILIGRFNA